jgi:hypothetical protein
VAETKQLPAWDIFISHASEDKQAVAIPLAVELKTYCLRLWLDRWILSPGDSLRQKIDEGLRSSRLGVVILSRSFFAKPWPRAELDALYTRGLVLGCDWFASSRTQRKLGNPRR